MQILLPVPHDGLEAGTLALCAGTASSLGASVKVLFVVDRAGIDRAEAGAPPGAIHLAEEAARFLASNEEARGERRVGEALAYLSGRGVEAEGEVREGDPLDVIAAEGAGRRLLVSSIGSRYAWRDRDRPGALALRVMAGGAVPVLLGGRADPEVEAVAVGCDGGERCRRAVEALAGLALWKGARIVLASSHKDPDERDRRMAEPRTILSRAGYGRLEERHLLPPKGESFPALCAREGVQAALLGGWGEHRWDDLLGLSLTGAMLRDGGFHLFLGM